MRWMIDDDRMVVVDTENGRQGASLVEMCAALNALDGGLMGAKDVAEMLGKHVPNLKHLKIAPIARISGGQIPVYLRADVERELELRAERRDEARRHHMEAAVEESRRETERITKLSAERAAASE